MAPRTYNQFCGVARALDVLGERWTLLVVRDLLPGPRRFTDLAARQPGLSTDMLTSRLRTLEEHGLVERVPLPAPARGSMYCITDVGERLRPVIGELAKLGTHWLSDPVSTERRVDAAWALATIAEHLVDGAPTSGGLQVESGDEVLSLRVSPDGSARVVYGALDAPDVVASGPAFVVLGVLTGRIDDHPEVHLAGSEPDVDSWLAAVRNAVPFLTDGGSTS